MNQRTEQRLVGEILTLLTYNRVLHAHIRNTGAVIRRRDGSLTFGRSMFSQRGVPDILAWKPIDGKWEAIGSADPSKEIDVREIPLLRAYAIEVKSETGRLSPEQKEWLDRFTSIGGVSIVARKIEDVAGPLGIKL